MSVALWYDRECKSWMSDLGEVYSYHRRNGSFTAKAAHLFSADQVHECIRSGQPSIVGGVALAVDVRPKYPDEPLDEDSELRMFAHVTAHNGEWTYELFPAHWTDDPQTVSLVKVYLGRWPD